YFLRAVMTEQGFGDGGANEGAGRDIRQRFYVLFHDLGGGADTNFHGVLFAIGFHGDDRAVERHHRRLDTRHALLRRRERSDRAKLCQNGDACYGLRNFSTIWSVLSCSPCSKTRLLSSSLGRVRILD